MVQMIAAPSRVLFQASTWILLLMGIGDVAHVLLATLGDLHYVTATQLAGANAILASCAAVAKLIQQTIALTEEQKGAMIAAVQAAPLKGARDAGDTEPAGPK